jgi:hypothetical protein
MMKPEVRGQLEWIRFDKNLHEEKRDRHTVALRCLARWRLSTDDCAKESTDRQSIHSSAPRMELISALKVLK